MPAAKLTKNVFQRFIAIWKPNFLSLFLKEKSSGPTWGFWFTWNSVISLIVASIAAWFLWGFMDQAYGFVKSDKVPAFDFVFEDRKLVHTGLSDPYRVDLDEGVAFIVDLEGDKYDRSSLRAFEVAAIVNEDRIMIRDRNELQEVVFDWYEELDEARFTKNDALQFIDKILPGLKIGFVIGLFLGVWFFITLIRLLGMLWWAFLAWIVSLIAKIPGFTFGKSYLFIMNISFIPFLVGMGLLFTGIHIPFMGFLLYALVTGMHFYDVRHRKPLKKS